MIKAESLGEFFGWLKSHRSGKPSDTRPKVALSKAFLADIFCLVVNDPCTAEEIADQLGINFESVYLALRILREKELVIDLRGEYVVASQAGDLC